MHELQQIPHVGQCRHDGGELLQAGRTRGAVGLRLQRQHLGNLRVVEHRLAVGAVHRERIEQEPQLAPRVAASEEVEQVELVVGVQVDLDRLAVPVDLVDQEGEAQASPAGR